VALSSSISQYSTRTLDNVLRAVQKILLLVGLALISFWLSARLHSLISAHMAVWAFTAAHESTNHQALIHKAVSANGRVVLSLWNVQRINSYKSVLAGKLDSPLAVLSIPRLGLVAPIFEGTDSFILNRSLGRIRGTATFDEDGNVGIAGHRDGLFRALRDVALGDAVEITTPHGLVQYIVNRISIVDPTDTDVLRSHHSPEVTLVTCYPFNFVGNAPRRYIVQASLRRSIQPLSAPPTASAQPEMTKEK
jgi:sortase A